MPIIKIDTDNIREYVNSLNGKISECEGLNARMEKLTENISENWQGESKNSFCRMMDGYISQSQKLIIILNQFRNYAQNAADEFEAADAECAYNIRNSF